MLTAQAAVLDLLQRKRRPLSMRDMAELDHGVYSLELILRRLEEQGLISPGPAAPHRTWVLA